MKPVNKITPTAEAVFTDEYWGPVADLPETDKPHGHAGPFFANRQQIEELCAQAATSIFRGGDLERIPDGATLDRSLDNRFTLPGTVVLIDHETLKPAEDDEPLPDKEPYWKSRAMRNPEELLAAPASLFRAHSRRALWPPDPLTPFRTPRMLVMPYLKTLRNLELSMDYERLVGLVVFSHDRDGNTRGDHKVMWSTKDPMEVIGDCRFRDIFSKSLMKSVHFPIETGTSYEAGETGEEDGTIIRIKSMDICLRGSLHYAGAKRRLRLPRLAGRMATAPQAT